MKGVILAAGIASRLRPLTDATPKCLLPLGGSTLLGRTLDNLAAAGIRDIVIVTGYLEDQIRRYVGANHAGLKTTFIRNDVYASTNNIYSLWLAREAVRREGMVLLDSDILFDPSVLPAVLGADAPAGLAVKTGRELGEEEIKVEVDDLMHVRMIGKHVPPDLAAGESIGIEVFSPAAMERLFAAMERKVVAEGQVNVFYEAAFQAMIDAGGTIMAVDIGDALAIEIDTIDDFRRAERDILPQLPRTR
ncbi:MAG: phosphocholine cytidylyltransferase family protein [Candidatus Aminicenantes bacterium]|nr:phosphocholine cytidylyltransferase family protein [Candidatus Aminicenantes bacterium]